MFPALSAKNNKATKPVMTNNPTQKSNEFFFIFETLSLLLIYVENITAVNKKSNAKTANEEMTTVLVVAKDTPSGVGLDS